MLSLIRGIVYSGYLNIVQKVHFMQNIGSYPYILFWKWWWNT